MFAACYNPFFYTGGAQLTFTPLVSPQSDTFSSSDLSAETRGQNFDQKLMNDAQHAEQVHDTLVVFGLEFQNCFFAPI